MQALTNRLLAPFSHSGGVGPPGSDEAVEAGEQVTICRQGSPVVDLVGTQSALREQPKLGPRKDRIIIKDPDWWKPMTADEPDAFLDGR